MPITRHEAMRRVVAACSYGTIPAYTGVETAETLIALGATRDELDAVADEVGTYAAERWAAYFRSTVRTVARPGASVSCAPAAAERDTPAVQDECGEPGLFSVPDAAPRALMASPPSVQRPRRVRTVPARGGAL